MSELMKDPRFGNIAKDPKFRNMPKSKRKIKIDKRFRGMLTNKEFSVKYKYDKRGRPVNQSSSENLRKYYGGSSDDDTEEEEEENKSQDDIDSKSDGDKEADDSEKSKNLKKKKKQQSKKLKNQAKSEDKEIENKTSVGSDSDENKGDDDDNNEVNEDVSDKTKGKSSTTTQKLKDLSVDYARGHADLFSSSSSSEEEESEESDTEEGVPVVEHQWGEFDGDAERIDEATERLALCNMNWDQIRAVDIMVVLTSFLPPGGVIKSVTIYPTEFGLKRMQEEELKGPIEITGSTIEDIQDDEEESEKIKENLRQYEIKKLSYYAAIIVFDSKETAEAIYRSVDGSEYESSGNKIDLRVVTDDRVFDYEPKDVCDKYPDKANYKPRLFITKATQQVTVKSTWDETSVERLEVAEKINQGEIDKISRDDIAKYVAMSSSEEESGNEDDDEKVDNIEESGDTQQNKKKMSAIDRYKSLLQEATEREKKKKKSDIDFECTWGLDIKEKTEQLVKEKMDQKEKDELAPFDKYLLKRKEKKKAKLDKKKSKNKTGNTSDDSEDFIPSDVDMDDPYFKEEMMNMQPSKAKSKKSKKNAADSDNEQNNAELELLMLDKEDDKQKNHFDMNKIEEIGSLSKSKKKRLMKKNKANKSDFEDNFEINVEDPRFTAVYDSPDFNIDPTDPHYRNTKGTELIRKEKFKRQENNANSNKISVEERPVKRLKKSNTLDDETNALVRRIKSNTKNISKKIK